MVIMQVVEGLEEYDIPPQGLKILDSRPMPRWDHVQEVVLLWGLWCRQVVFVDLGRAYNHTSYLSILVHRRIIEVYKKYTKKLSELATK